MSFGSEEWGPWAVVTGASSGIGRELVVRLAARGLNVVVVARREAELSSLAEEIRGRHEVEVRTLVMDLGRPEAAGALLAATSDLDVGLVVLNAGFGGSGRFLEGDVARDLEMIALNCSSVLASAHGFGRRLVARGRGSLVLVSSVLAFQGTPYAATYGATKAFVQSLGEALEVELGAKGVSVLVLAPGPTRTEFEARAGLKMDLAMGAGEVADAAMRSLGARGTRFPGRLSWGLRALMVALPRWAASRIFGRVMAQMSAGAAVS